MTEENKTEEGKPKYEIRNAEKDGNVVREVVSAVTGNVVFALDQSFTEEQVHEVFELCDKFFLQGTQIGMQQGIQKLQADLQRLIGVAPPAPVAAPANQDDAESIEG